MQKLARIATGFLIAGVALAPAFSAAAKEETAEGAPKQRVVLPATVTPYHYRVAITPDAKSLSFAASVEIDIAVLRATDRIVLNSTDIVIDSVAVSGESVEPAVSYDEKVETATFTFGHKLKPGPYSLRILYRGKISQQASGLFALDYDTPKGKERALFTHFENADARRFLPCWDEPGRKATFELTATVPAEQMPISNMPVAATNVLPGGLKRVQFAITPKMSSYLLFFGTGDFERVHRDVAGVDVGVVVKRGDTASAGFALDAAAQILPFFNDYFGVPYPLPKLDLIAGPGSSQRFGAMENWGAIFFFERAMLIDPRFSIERDKQDVYLTMAHEIAHMWFGNLVTMAWWDDLWLNEGFASWMTNKVGDRFHPEWKLWLQALRRKQGAMSTDARDATHPVITPINDVLQASSAFDVITYSKGAAVIRTLESYLGEEEFRSGVRRYMRDHAYGNTVTDEFWRAMDRGSRRPITRIARDLTLQAGVPLVSEVSNRCEAGNTVLRLSQTHFTIDADSTTARVWQVPVIVSVAGGATVRAIVAGAMPKRVVVAGCGIAIVNAGQTGYYRSRYSKQSFAAIAAGFAGLSAEDQFGILNDTTSLAYTGDEPMSNLLDLTRRIAVDADPVVASALVDKLDALDRLYDGLPGQARFRIYARSVLGPLFARVGWDKTVDEGNNSTVLRADLIDALSQLDDPEVLAEAKRRYDRYLADAVSLDTDARRSALNVVGLHADSAIWDQLHGLARSTKSLIERREFYRLLSTAKDESLARQALDLALSGEPPPTTVPDMVYEVANLHPEMAFDFALAHWDVMEGLIEPSVRPRYMTWLIYRSTDVKMIAKLESFADKHIPVNARKDVRKAVALLRYLARVRNERLPEVDRWLKGRRDGME